MSNAALDTKACLACHEPLDKNDGWTVEAEHQGRVAVLGKVCDKCYQSVNDTLPDAYRVTTQ